MNCCDNCLNTYDTCVCSLTPKLLTFEPPVAPEPLDAEEQMTLEQRTAAALAWINGQLEICYRSSPKPWVSERAMGPSSMGEFTVESYVDSTGRYEKIAYLYPKNDENNASFIEASRLGYPQTLLFARQTLEYIIHNNKWFGGHNCCMEDFLDALLVRIESLSK